MMGHPRFVEPWLRLRNRKSRRAALSIAAGAHPKLIAARLGHSTIQITLDRYGHLFPSVEEALAVALDAVFTAGSSVFRSQSYADRRISGPSWHRVPTFAARRPGVDLNFAG